MFLVALYIQDIILKLMAYIAPIDEHKQISCKRADT